MTPIRVLMVCHGNIPKRLKDARKIKGSGRLEGAYHTTTTPI